MKLWISIALIVGLWAPAIIHATDKKFVVFDSTLYRNKPDFRQYDIHPLRILYGQVFWDKGEDRDSLPNMDTVSRSSRKVSETTDLVAIDIEHWPVKGSLEAVRESVRKYTTVAQWFHLQSPKLRLGYYGVPPVGDYWRAIAEPSSAKYVSWQADNDRLRALAKEIDVFFPSIYTHYPNREMWVQYAISQINEARRYDSRKPVYVFLWPQYHVSNKLLRWKFIPPEYWELQLKTARKHADGIVIWGGWGMLKETNKKGRMVWDEQAPWWLVTKRFMENEDNRILER